MAELPPKLFFRIGEVAGLVGVEPHVLRYWEREFRSIRPTKSAKGQRVYSRKDVENLLRVRDLLYRDGFTIAGAKKKLQRGAVDEDAAILGRTVRPSGGTGTTVYADASPTATAATLARSAASATAGAQAIAHGEVRPAATAPAAVEPERVRQKLRALRDEVEAFLVELSPGARAR